MNASSKLRYYTAAVALSAGWMIVMLSAPLAAEWIWEAPFVNLVFFSISGIITARIFQNWIYNSDSVAADLGRAIAITPVAATIYLSFWVLYLIIVPGFDSSLFPAGNGSSPNFRDALLVVPWGLFSMAASFYTVVPYAWLCQYILRRVLEEQR